jgi:hypothetical protein
MVIYQVARALGLSINLKPIINETLCGGVYILPDFGHKEEEDGVGEEYSEFDLLGRVFGHSVQTIEKGEDDGDDDNDLNYHSCVEPCLPEDPILSTMHYGNEATAYVFYQSATLLVQVPAFSSLRGYPDSAKEREDGEK